MKISEAKKVNILKKVVVKRFQSIKIVKNLRALNTNLIPLYVNRSVERDVNERPIRNATSKMSVRQPATVSVQQMGVQQFCVSRI